MMLSSVVDAADGSFQANEADHSAFAEELQRVLAEAAQGGQPLRLVGAMNMEQPIAAPGGGIVIALHVTAGETVEAGNALVEVYPSEIEE